MKNKLRSDFQTRQYMISKDFEIFYYSDLHFRTMPFHSHNYYEFYFFLQGEMSIELEKDLIPLKGGDIVVIPPQKNHRAVIRDPEVPYRRFVFWISREYYERLSEISADYRWLVPYSQACHKYVYHPEHIIFQSLLSHLFLLLDELHQNRFGKKEQISLHVCGLLLALNRSVYELEHPVSHYEEQNLYQGIVNYIENHLDEELSLDRLATTFYVSKYYISHLFKEASGLSIHQYITKKRLNACCQSISSGERISAVYEQFGFRDYSSFYRAFMREYNMSPKTYQELHKIRGKSKAMVFSESKTADE